MGRKATVQKMTKSGEPVCWGCNGKAFWGKSGETETGELKGLYIMVDLFRDENEILKKENETLKVSQTSAFIEMPDKVIEFPFAEEIDPADTDMVSAGCAGCRSKTFWKYENLKVKGELGAMCSIVRSRCAENEKLKWENRMLKENSEKKL